MPERTLFFISSLADLKPIPYFWMKSFKSVWSKSSSTFCQRFFSPTTEPSDPLKPESLHTDETVSSKLPRDGLQSDEREPLEESLGKSSKMFFSFRTSCLSAGRLNCWPFVFLFVMAWKLFLPRIERKSYFPNSSHAVSQKWRQKPFSAQLTVRTSFCSLPDSFFLLFYVLRLKLRFSENFGEFHTNSNFFLRNASGQLEGQRRMTVRRKSFALRRILTHTDAHFGEFTRTQINILYNCKWSSLETKSGSAGQWKRSQSCRTMETMFWSKILPFQRSFRLPANSLVGVTQSPQSKIRNKLSLLNFIYLLNK